MLAARLRVAVSVRRNSDRNAQISGVAVDHLRMRANWIARVRRRLARVSVRGTAAVVMSLVVVLAMVAVAAFSRQSADVHRRAQVLVEELRGDAQELSSLRWRVNTEVLLGNADLAPVVTEGVGLVSAMNAQLAQLGELQPGADTDRLRDDVHQFYAIGSQQLAALRALTAAKKNPNELGGRIASQFQPVLDRMDSDVQRASLHQQVVAGAAIERADIGSIGSMLLGLAALAALGWRLGEPASPDDAGRRGARCSSVAASSGSEHWSSTQATSSRCSAVTCGCAGRPPRCSDCWATSRDR